MQDCCIGFFENSKPSILVFRHDSEQFLVSKPEHDQGQLGPKDKLGEASLKPEGSTESGGKEALCSLSDSVSELRSLPSFLAFVIDSTGATLQPQGRRRPSGHRWHRWHRLFQVGSFSPSSSAFLSATQTLPCDHYYQILTI